MSGIWREREGRGRAGGEEENKAEANMATNGEHGRDGGHGCSEWRGERGSRASKRGRRSESRAVERVVYVRGATKGTADTLRAVAGIEDRRSAGRHHVRDPFVARALREYFVRIL